MLTTRKLKNFSLLLSFYLLFPLTGCDNNQTQPENPPVQPVSEVREVSQELVSDVAITPIENSIEQFAVRPFCVIGKDVELPLECQRGKFSFLPCFHGRFV